MSKYNPEKHKKWYAKNWERLLPIRRAYNKLWRESQHGKDFDKLRNSSPERKAYRKIYKTTKAGIESETKYRKKPNVRERYERYRIKRLYGITQEIYWRMVADQKGLCAICKQSNGKKLHIDHEHKSGKIRDLLCGNCNRALGLLKENVDYLKNAQSYLNEQVHKNQSPI